MTLIWHFSQALDKILLLNDKNKIQNIEVWKTKYCFRNKYMVEKPGFICQPPAHGLIAKRVDVITVISSNISSFPATMLFLQCK